MPNHVLLAQHGKVIVRAFILVKVLQAGMQLIDRNEGTSPQHPESSTSAGRPPVLKCVKRVKPDGVA